MTPLAVRARRSSKPGHRLQRYTRPGLLCECGWMSPNWKTRRAHLWKSKAVKA